MKIYKGYLMVWRQFCSCKGRESSQMICLDRVCHGDRMDRMDRMDRIDR